MLEGESLPDARIAGVECYLEENGQSLLIVDLLSLRTKFTFKRYRVDLMGFVKAFGFVLLILGIAILTTLF